MDAEGKATRIDLFSFRSPQMRTFHVTWVAFFLCFFAWFGIAPLMKVVREELGLTKEQIGNTIIASVAITVLARLFIGWLCDRVGPRLAYSWLLILARCRSWGLELHGGEVSAISSGIPRQDTESSDRRVCPNEEVREWSCLATSATSILNERLPRKEGRFIR